MVFHNYNHVSLILSKFKIFYRSHERCSVDTDEDGYRGFPLPVSCCVLGWSFLSVSTNSKFASRVARCLGESEKHAKLRSVARRGILETDRKMELVSMPSVKNDFIKDSFTDTFW